eukprot:355903-Chlamydomonas_euryale.AAC.4
MSAIGGRSEWRPGVGMSAIGGRSEWRRGVGMSAIGGGSEWRRGVGMSLLSRGQQAARRAVRGVGKGGGGGRSLVGASQASLPGVLPEPLTHNCCGSLPPRHPSSLPPSLPSNKASALPKPPAWPLSWLPGPLSWLPGPLSWPAPQAECAGPHTCDGQQDAHMRKPSRRRGPATRPTLWPLAQVPPTVDNTRESLLAKVEEVRVVVSGRG